MSTINFHRPLGKGSVGRDVIAVKRALSRAGFMRWQKFTPLFGPFMESAMKKFQEAHNIQPTGRYGGKTHKALLPYFDRLGRQMYEASSKKGSDAVPTEGSAPAPHKPGNLRLRATFRPTHPTAGLPGYWAIDEFAKPGTFVEAPVRGTVVKISGKDPHAGGRPGGAFGWSIYLKEPGVIGPTHYMTHFGKRFVKLGQQIALGEVIGTVADPSVTGDPRGASSAHIHHGSTAARP